MSILIKISPLLLIGAGLASGQQCDELKNLGMEDLVHFLEAHPPADRSKPFCTEFALHEIGTHGYAAGIPILLKFLTLRRELTDWEKTGVQLHPGGDPYPGPDALFNFGVAILPQLVEYLAAERTRQERSNALEVVEYNFRDEPPEGVKFLLNERQKRSSPDAKSSLDLAAEELATRCPPASRDACSAALKAAQ